ncbi:hypothetical protein AX14_001672 [Amanita brunnescens Koide BX004]|nr:hypothetical protein AX14_001672 [Amanita brunnescens Koide BX004]
MSSGRTPSVAIIGAGLAGISTAIALKKQLNFDNFVIYEKANAVGGTWRDNTYPGCGSDVAVHWYSLSTELNPYWPSYYASQPEIQAYWTNLWHKHKLESHTKLGHLVRHAEWDATMQRYHLKVENVATSEMTESDAEIIFHAVGGFISPAYPKDIQGIGTFCGDSWHSARWNHDVDLRGKRVGVIGNGCSASQFIPEISKDPSTTVVNFVRTPQWYSPRTNIHYPAWLQWVFAHVPFIMRLYRNFIMAKADIEFLVFQKGNKKWVSGAKQELTNYMKEMAPKEYVDKLIPPFSVGCKRIVVNHGYLECLHQPNVSLLWERIDCIVQEGIKLKTGEIVPLDVIIFGTGYSSVAAELTIRGSKGLTLAEFYQQHGGGTAYLGTCRPGFPNLFHVLGPNTATGHASVIFTEEVQVRTTDGHGYQRVTSVDVRRSTTQSRWSRPSSIAESSRLR